MDIRREKALIRFMHARCHIRPPKEGLDERGAIINAYFQFQTGATRMQTDSVHSLHPAHGVMITAPDSFGTIRMFLYLKIHGKEGRGTMMLRPVEFDTARNPGTGEPDQRGLDNRLIVNQIVTVGFVLQDMNASTDFREHHRADEFILDPNGFPAAIDWLLGNAICERQGINFSAATLIHALF